MFTHIPMWGIVLTAVVLVLLAIAGLVWYVTKDDDIGSPWRNL